MKVRARLRPDARRAQLLELGGRLFSERAYDEFSMDDIAAEAGVSKGLLYHYFPTKRAFYMAALREATAEMLELIEPEPGLSPDEALRRGLAGYLGYVREHAGAYRAVLRGGIGADPEVLGIADAFREAAAGLILAATGAPARPSTRLAVRGWIGFVEAVSLDWIERPEPSLDRLIEMLTGALASILEAVQEA